MKKILFLSLVAAFIFSGCSLADIGSKTKVLSPEEAKAKVVEFINTNLMQPGSEASIKEITEEGELFKVVVNIPGGQEIESYMTRDGAKFFPQVMNIDEINEQNAGDQAGADANKPAEVADVPKAEKANVELFVMSHCPYGTQIEKGIIPVLETLGDKVDFELKFNDYAMHGKIELDEQLNQHCIKENEPEKLFEYLKCFLGEQNAGEKCLDEAGINQTRLSSCVKSTDTEFKVTELFNDENTWVSGRFPQFNLYKEDSDKYGVGGSPTLVINGATISSARDSDSLLRTICAGYETPPAECDTELSAASPSPGFGYGTSGGSTDAGCGT